MNGKELEIWTGYEVNTMLETISGAISLTENLWIINQDLHVFKIEFFARSSGAAAAVTIGIPGTDQTSNLLIPTTGLTLGNDVRIRRADSYNITFSKSVEFLTIVQHYIQPDH
jgi:hypothetical protein